jgi:hypothetical protein
MPDAGMNKRFGQDAFQTENRPGIDSQTMPVCSQSSFKQQNQPKKKHENAREKKSIQQSFCLNSHKNILLGQN